MISRCQAILSLLSLLMLSFSLFVFASPESDEANEIEALLTVQSKCWNDGDIDGFMQTYWKSADLTFSGSGKTTRGWQATLDQYKKSYPREKMGTLTFDGLEVTMLSEEAALVLGNWHLSIPKTDVEEGAETDKKEDEKKDGNFSLVLRKLDGAWKIIHDHSSTLKTEEE